MMSKLKFKTINECVNQSSRFPQLGINCKRMFRDKQKNTKDKIKSKSKLSKKKGLKISSKKGLRSKSSKKDLALRLKQLKEKQKLKTKSKFYKAISSESKFKNGHDNKNLNQFRFKNSLKSKNKSEKSSTETSNLKTLNQSKLTATADLTKSKLLNTSKLNTNNNSKSKKNKDIFNDISKSMFSNLFPKNNDKPISETPNIKVPSESNISPNILTSNSSIKQPANENKLLTKHHTSLQRYKHKSKLKSEQQSTKMKSINKLHSNQTKMHPNLFKSHSFNKYLSKHQSKHATKMNTHMHQSQIKAHGSSVEQAMSHLINNGNHEHKSATININSSNTTHMNVSPLDPSPSKTTVSNSIDDSLDNLIDGVIDDKGKGTQGKKVNDITSTQHNDHTDFSFGKGNQDIVGVNKSESGRSLQFKNIKQNSINDNHLISINHNVNFVNVNQSKMETMSNNSHLNTHQSINNSHSNILIKDSSNGLLNNNNLNSNSNSNQNSNQNSNLQTKTQSTNTNNISSAININNSKQVTSGSNANIFESKSTITQSMQQPSQSNHFVNQTTNGMNMTSKIQSMNNIKQGKQNDNDKPSDPVDQIVANVLTEQRRKDAAKLAYDLSSNANGYANGNNKNSNNSNNTNMYLGTGSTNVSHNVIGNSLNGNQGNDQILTSFKSENMNVDHSMNQGLDANGQFKKIDSVNNNYNNNSNLNNNSNNNNQSYQSSNSQYSQINPNPNPNPQQNNQNYQPSPQNQNQKTSQPSDYSQQLKNLSTNYASNIPNPNQPLPTPQPNISSMSSEFNQQLNIEKTMVTSINTDISSAKQNISDLLNQIKDLSRLRNDISAGNHQMSKEFKETKDKMYEAKTSLYEYSNQRDVLREEIKKYNDAKNILFGTSKQIQTILDAQTKDSVKYQNQIGEDKNTLMDIKKQIKDWRINLDQTKNDQNNEQRTKDQLEDQIKSLKAKKYSLMGRNQQLTSRNDLLAANLVKIESKFKSKRSEFNTLKINQNRLETSEDEIARTIQTKTKLLNTMDVSTQSQNTLLTTERKNMSDLNIRKRQYELEQDLKNNANNEYVKQITSQLLKGEGAAKNIQSLLNKENKMMSETQNKYENGIRQNDVKKINDNVNQVNNQENTNTQQSEVKSMTQNTQYNTNDNVLNKNNDINQISDTNNYSKQQNINTYDQNNNLIHNIDTSIYSAPASNEYEHITDKSQHIVSNDVNLNNLNNGGAAGDQPLGSTSDAHLMINNGDPDDMPMSSLFGMNQ